MAFGDGQQERSGIATCHNSLRTWEVGKASRFCSNMGRQERLVLGQDSRSAALNLTMHPIPATYFLSTYDFASIASTPIVVVG